MIDKKKLVLCLLVSLSLYTILVKAESARVCEMRYWFDNNEATVIKATSGEPVHIPFDITNSIIVFTYQVKDTEGNWSVPHRHYFEVPKKKYGSILDNMTLSLKSKRGNLEKNISVKSDQSHIDIDVKDLDQGIYNITSALLNPNNGSVIALTNNFVNIKPFGDTSLKGIYYWLNDSISKMSECHVENGNLPISRIVNVPISSKGIPSFDNKLTIINGKPEIAPNYTLSVAFRNSTGFIVDSIAWITDNSRRHPLLPYMLENRMQHDNENAKNDTCYWYAFKAQKGDVIDFSARRPCIIKLYDPIAQLKDTVTFNDDCLSLRSDITTTGSHYIQVSEIETSRQIYSTLLKYIIGPTATEYNQNNGNSLHKHEGKLLNWKSLSEWREIDRGFQYTKDGVELIVANVDGNIEPYISGNTTLCRVYPKNSVQLNSKVYIEKAVFCVQNSTDLVLPKIECANGNLSIDSLTNCVEWTGLSDHVELTISSNPATENIVFPINCVYVTLSDLNREDVIIDENDDLTANLYQFKTINIWSDGKLLATHSINEYSQLYIEENVLTVHCDNIKYSYPFEKNLILTYEMIDDSVPDFSEDIEIEIKEEGIMFKSLPAFVSIYSVSGHNCFAKYVSDPDFMFPLESLSPGIYIIRVGNKISKIMIH